MIFTPSFIDFSTEYHFLNLQNKFLSYDERSIGMVEEIQLRGGKGIFTEVKKEDFCITYKTLDINNVDHYKDIYFYKEFITSNIETLAIITINQITSRIKKDFLHNELERKSYITLTIQNIKNLDIQISNAIYLSKDINILLSGQLELVLDYLYENNLSENLFKFDEKIQLKMNKNDILAFFILLRQKGIIKYPYNAELGKLIDNHFLYYDKTTDDYKEIQHSNKLLSEYGNGSKSISKSITRLKDFFTKGNFFHLK
ncbi:hypothetical protein QLS31_12145 [Flavobacterium sp. XS2P24]|uniref:hypothetical protein n=1 Tax=Flavobacterium sp. XS2P24 TaxID=3041249 RepID=UPI0024A9EE84|nr:hypothetical protein [Flavobacterium sp. XS2P24]MDI6050583.1 hypothetical protein [Flavobacterium sp. XS2P24]